MEHGPTFRRYGKIQLANYFFLPGNVDLRELIMNDRERRGKVAGVTGVHATARCSLSWNVPLDIYGMEETRFR